MDLKEYLLYWRDKYKEDLLNNILPFWLDNGFDAEYGGILTCLDREGRLMDSTKSVWFQGRFAFTAAFAYNNVEKDERLLQVAKSTLDFIDKYCFDATDGRMYFEVSRDGTPIRKRRYVFSETFATIAYAEYALATGSKEYAQKALDLFKRTLHFLETDGVLPNKYEPTVKQKGHSIVMILINTASRVRKVIKDEVLTQQIDQSLEDIFTKFMHPEFKALLEVVGSNGEFIDSNSGRLINPGHCIETAWFILEEARYRNWDARLVDKAMTIFDWSWDWGWDKEFGGIINFKDCKNYPCQDYAQDMKFWWPQTEAIIATLYGYLATEDEAYIEKHKMISDWTYKHLVDNEYKEWYGYLHRDGSVAQSAKGNLFKGPFHIPRMMVMGYMLCDDILRKLETPKV